MSVILDIFADSDIEGNSSIPMKPSFDISMNTGSAVALTWVKKQLEICDTSSRHDRCRASVSQQLPHRIVEITGSRSARLCVTKSGEHSEYACLSHCWGTTQPLTTTTRTIKAYLKSILWNKIPKTFRHAITTAYNLGLKYIWIDSLCIVQDDIQDWRTEGGKMADIYENSYLTISAVSSSGSSGGLFGWSHWEHRTRSISFRDTQHKIYVRKPLDHYENPDSSRERGGPMKLPLLTRAWAFQELLLSPRVVHFSNDEIVWECRSSCDCECSLVQSDPFRSFNKSVFNLHSTDAGRLPSEWRQLVAAYTARDLTYQKDIFPALQGLAKRLEGMRKSPYLAGLWQDTLVCDLLWRRHFNVRYDPQHRPVQWRATTWSWAAVLGWVDWPTLKDSEDRIVARATATTEPAGKDPFGELKSGMLILNAPCLKVTMRFIRYDDYVLSIEPLAGTDVESTPLRGLKRRDLSTSQFYGDFDLGSDVAADGSVLMYFHLAVMVISRSRYCYCLVLRRGGENRDVFERVGLLECEVEPHVREVFLRAKEQTWTIQ
ncbi:HET-domain-containing protein [Trematosphaeria pertusa]|uniref:HET-domain-containing protein n=1 Tax=Trematosphaeria pertusa TaxID=390896 RepID=A0A6A6HSL1_9PLEO|nr:HET-domain-containing protein [Trematosphaeria pertusa]KAF2241001.1 HET-domain-containing protein [Trematosphaeria pertusa]